MASQLDVKNAFLHGNLNETVYVMTLNGFANETGKVGKLNKALYGLKQASRAWNLTFDERIKKLGFTAAIQLHFTAGSMFIHIH